MCDFLNRPKDGSVTFTSTTFGAEARYACNPGYRLEGVEIRTCQANGEWSDEKPSCTSEFGTCRKSRMTTSYV